MLDTDEVLALLDAEGRGLVAKLGQLGGDIEMQAENLCACYAAGRMRKEYGGGRDKSRLLIRR